MVFYIVAMGDCGEARLSLKDIKHSTKPNYSSLLFLTVALSVIISRFSGFKNTLSETVNSMLCFSTPLEASGRSASVVKYASLVYS